jgi:hypothetical protein
MEDLILNMTSNDNLGFTRQIVARETEGGTPIVLVDLYANVRNTSTDQSINYNINVVNKALVSANQVAVQAEIDKFLAEIREKTAAMDIVSL